MLSYKLAKQRKPFAYVKVLKRLINCAQTTMVSSKTSQFHTMNVPIKTEGSLTVKHHKLARFMHVPRREGSVL